MRHPGARALPLFTPVDRLSLDETDWIRLPSDRLEPPWPPRNERIVVALWASNSHPTLPIVALVQDKRITREYYWSLEHDMHRLQEFAEEGLVHDPIELISVALEGVENWATMIDTMNDAIAGCIDPEALLIQDVWLHRIGAANRLVRLAACRAAPYITGSIVRSVLEEISHGDPDGEIRSIARESLASILR